MLHPFAGIQTELQGIAREIEARSARHGVPVGCMAGYFVEKLGQMLRPGLVVLASRAAGGGPWEAVRDLGALVELVHCASLLHDDVVDDAETRRSRPTVYRRWGDRQSVLLGDLLLAQALACLAPHSTPATLATVRDITRDLAEGQLLELEAEGRHDLPVEHYLRIIHLKTATFFGHSARLGAEAASAPPETAEALQRFGTALGMAYQILDDLLDAVGDEAELGKTVRADLANGRPTLPLLRLLELEAGDGPTTRALAEGRSAQLAVELPGWMHASGAYARVVADARRIEAEARSALAGLGPSADTGALTGLVDYVFARLDRMAVAPRVSSAPSAAPRIPTPRAAR